MHAIGHIYTKQEILEILKEPKFYKGGSLNDTAINRKMKLKPNNPAFYKKF